MRKFLLSILGITSIGFVSAIVWWNSNLTSVNPQDKSETLFVITPGSNLSTIANKLKKEGLIRNPLVFRLLVKQLKLDTKIQAGDFRLSPSMTAKQIAQELTKGSLDVWVTIPEGKRAEEVAEILKEKLPTYDPSWEAKLIEYEGYLFPDTYLLPKDASIETIINIFTNTFEQKFSQIDTSKTTLTKEQLVTLASLIEREARHDEDRPLISSVIHNRLNIGMALQIDATIQYAKGKVGSTWWSPITVADYRSVKSPYNTYLQPGLPPRPIASPGLKALQAAANPTKTNYLYYITDQKGVNRYAKTVEEHEANKRKYGLSS